MNAELMQAMRDEIRFTIKEAVNGKIDAINAKIDTHNVKHEEDMVEIRVHIAETKPILKAYEGGKVLGELIKWLAGVGVAYLAIKTFITGNPLP